MSINLNSYYKTIIAMVFMSTFLLLLFWGVSARIEIAISMVTIFLALGALYAAIVVLAGFIVIWREKTEIHNNLFMKFNSSRSENALSLDGVPIPRWRRWYRGLTRKFIGYPFLVGDVVEVLSFSEISKTLDSNGCLDNIPFMPEMIPYCGKRFRIFRCVDKIGDYGVTGSLRRMRDAYLLSGLRCNGSGHGGCQAGCYLLWKSAWLKPASDVKQNIISSNEDTQWISELAFKDKCGKRCYMCQFTQIVPATTRLSEWDYRQDIRPLFTGNVTLRAFVITVFIRIFNWVQSIRGAAIYPYLWPKSNGKVVVELGLQPGDRVRVLDKSIIETTIAKDRKNCGLGFLHEEMIRYCNKSYTVLARVDRIIYDVTGEMIQMKTPCILLEGIYNTGEFIRFSPQCEHVFWREAWLERDESINSLQHAKEVCIAKR